VRQRLLGRIDEAASLDGLRQRDINYDPALAPQDGRPEGHWHVDSATTAIGQEPSGPPEQGGPWQMACQLVSQYEFADGPILRAVYRRDQELLGRDMLLEGRFWGLRFYLGVRITRIIDETRDTGNGSERVWGWAYQTLQGHLEQGRLTYEVIKNLRTGQVMFRVTGYSRPAPISNLLIRWGFRLFGHWAQQRFYRKVQMRMSRLLRTAQCGLPLPTPTVRDDGLVLAPSGVRARSLERLAPRWLHAGG
jgi:uncharacterized protein (UPF0548 family)